ncbi:MAG: signal peptidase I [Clostridia bacterium]|nr:signal peptidase I [Clostridia bacterium]
MKGNIKALNRTVTVIGIILCVVFGALLLMNITIIVKGLINPDWPPSVFGITPMVVKSGSMSSDQPHRVVSDSIIDLTEEQIQSLKVGDTFKTKSGDYIETNIVETVSSSDDGPIVFIASRPASGHIEVDDLIFVGGGDFQDLEVGQIITFFEANDNGDRTGMVITHRIVEVTEIDGARVYRTKGDANNTIDTVPVRPQNIIGVYKSRVAKLGALVLFLQKPWGMVIFIGIPVLAFIIYDIIRRQRNAGKGGKVNELEDELERLRKRVAEMEGKDASPDIQQDNVTAAGEESAGNQ